ncbi:hypothetical protein GWL_38740 [Herbaspirillum sp. GW103]|uniref:hypothetical protein n=1 Tax=unclassified Herbaspirillum TaxID=2624150 RepID=UPI00025E462D|nr:MULTISPECIES: hypothetical protein [unclassified Herbaspirillum]EIJ44435.1 hypothetical protein GWL_38740 [Herbaspirillum sp. GW103]MCI1007449.1 hypothetical protein [Herbaspirillum sp. C7C8]
MPHSRRHEIAHQFAEGLVAQMLQRSGNAFFHVTPSCSGEHIDFLVSKGDDLCGIDVRYAEHKDGVEQLWNEWKQYIRACRPRHGSALGRTIKAIRPGQPTRPADPEVHLVVVTGRGDRIYAEQTIAPLLTPDVRTHISVLGE